eukprot:364673-Chlamydomonas_euryale.AAC.8
MVPPNALLVVAPTSGCAAETGLIAHQTNPTWKLPNLAPNDSSISSRPTLPRCHHAASSTPAED